MLISILKTSLALFALLLVAALFMGLAGGFAEGYWSARAA